MNRLEKIKIKQRKLNTEEFLPKFAYRRNSVVYPLICHVNNMMGCLNAQHLKAVPIFIERIKQFMDEYPKLSGAESYYTLVAMYLIDVEKYLIEKNRL